MVWTKNFDSAGWSNHDEGYTGVAVDSNDDVIVVQSEQITKVSSTGTVLWQKEVEPNQPFSMWNSCVDVDSDNNIYLAAEYNYWGGPADNFLIIKFDTDGNVLWQREAGTSFEENSNWNDGHQILTVQGNRFYVAGSYYAGNNDTALGFSLPTDGTGASNESFGGYLYRETEWTISTSTSTIDVMEIGFQYAEVVSTTTNTFSVSTVTNDVVELTALRTGDVDGRINDLYSVTFEDGSVQKTAYVGGMPVAADGNFFYDTNNFYPNLTHANRLMRWNAPGWNDTVNIFIPHNDDIAFPIGTQMHFVKEQGIYKFKIIPWASFGDTNDMVIMPGSPDSNLYGSMYNSGEGWSVHHYDFEHVPAKVTITKVDTNRWLLTCDSSNQIMDWNW